MGLCIHKVGIINLYLKAIEARDSKGTRMQPAHTHTHMYTYTYKNICDIYICVCVCKYKHMYLLTGQCCQKLIGFAFGGKTPLCETHLTGAFSTFLGG